jgi:NADH-quinone oxidoreductase subunit H
MMELPDFSHLFRLANIVVVAVVAWLIPLNMVPVFIWLERKGSAIIQDRTGPNRAAILGFRLFGMLHNIADTLKLFMKEDILPARANRLAYYAAPAIAMMVALLPLMLVPFAAPLPLFGETLRFEAAGFGVGLLFLIALSGLGVFGLLLGGWGSNNKLSLMGGLRSASQFISYELAVGLSVVGLLMAYGTADIGKIVEAQGLPLVVGGVTLPVPAWGLFVQPVAFILFLVGAFAETNRNPFDLPEGESELVAGYHVEYSSMKFALFFMAEYSHMTVASVVLATLFLGGYQVPFASTETLRSHPREVLQVLCLGTAVSMSALAAVLAGLGFRRAYDKGRRLEIYAYALGALGLVISALVALWLLPGWTLPSWLPYPLTALVQFACLLGKMLFFCWLFVWVRWTLPRFRFDQLMGLGWKILLPLGLLNVVVTALWVVFAK